jgi:hypothetical protein
MRFLPVLSLIQARFEPNGWSYMSQPLNALPAFNHFTGVRSITHPKGQVGTKIFFRLSNHEGKDTASSYYVTAADSSAEGTFVVVRAHDGRPVIRDV